MGADLYIHKLFDKTEKKYRPLFEKAARERDSVKNPTKAQEKKLQAKVDKYYDLMYSRGYFRDSYNDYNVLNRLGLSYWRDLPALMKGNDISPQNAAILAKMIERRDLDLKGVKPEDKEYFIKKREELLRFLRTAKKLNSVIDASI